MATFCFVISKPGNDIDGEPAEFCEHSLEAAQIRADRHARSCGATLKLVGQKVNGKFTPAVSYDEQPWWSREWIDEQREREAKEAAAKARAKQPRARKPAPKLTKAQRARVKEMVEDEGASRQEALAWVTHFEVAS